MRPIQFGAEAKYNMQASLGAPIPKPFENLGPLQKTFDTFRRQVAEIPWKTIKEGSAEAGNEREFIVDEQSATVLVDSEGARTEIKTRHNGSRTVSWPEGLQNTVANWRKYLSGIAADMKVREAQLLTEDERIEKVLKESEELISEIAPALQNGDFQNLGDPAEIRRLKGVESTEYRPEPLTLNIRIGEREYTVTRRHRQSVIWQYEITPKAQPGRVLSIELNTDPRYAEKYHPLRGLTYRDEDNFQLDLENHWRDLDKYEEPGFFDSDKKLQAFSARQERRKAQSNRIWEHHMRPMAKALIPFDQRTRLYHRYHER